MGLRSQANQAFEPRSEIAAQPLVQPAADLDTLLEQARRVKSNFTRFTEALATEIGAAYEVAPLKSVERINEKVSKFDGDYSRITDMRRGRTIIQTVEQLEKAREILNPAEKSSFLQAWEKEGFQVRSFEDLFAQPSKAGYMALTVKLAVPLEDGDNHITELQVQHEAMLPAYKKTHELYEAQRSFSSDFRNAADGLDTQDAVDYARMTQERREIHMKAAQQAGLITDAKIQKYVNLDIAA